MDYSFMTKMVIAWAFGIMIGLDLFLIGFWGYRLVKWIRKKRKQHKEKALSE